MEAKRYDIENISDLLAAYQETENKEDLLQDLRSFVITVSGMIDMARIVGGDAGADKFTWIDDREHNGTVNIITQE